MEIKDALEIISVIRFNVPTVDHSHIAVAEIECDYITETGVHPVTFRYRETSNSETLELVEGERIDDVVFNWLFHALRLGEATKGRVFAQKVKKDSSNIAIATICTI
jgi:hypothetical protein